MASDSSRLCSWFIVNRKDGKIIRAVNHTTDVEIDGETYYARAGGQASDISMSSALNVDNSEQTGPLTLGFIRAEDLKAGIYRGATYSCGLVNYDHPEWGVYHQQDGPIGQITINRGTYVMERRGLMQYLQQSFGRTYIPNCPHTLGDSRCGVDLTSFTFDGTLKGMSPDGMTFFDSDRTEAGPSGGVAITAVTNANPCHITLASALGLPTGTAVLFSGITEPAELNGPLVMRNVSGSEFDVDVDSTLMQPWSSDGIVTPFSNESGYFDHGLMTILDTNNENYLRYVAVKLYIEGQWTVEEPFPYDLSGFESYRLIAGCDKTLTTCRVKFSNQARNGGYPYIAGQDHRMQVGRSE